MANAAIGDVDCDVVRARRAALDIERHERRLFGDGSESFRHRC
jgi:hypothetical protein